MSYAKFIYRYNIPIVLVSLLLFTLSFHFVKKLSVRSDFKEMLPGNAPSVLELNRIEKRVRSTDNLIVLIGGPDWPTTKTFVDDFVARVQDELGADISRIEFNVNEDKNYYEHNKYL